MLYTIYICVLLFIVEMNMMPTQRKVKSDGRREGVWAKSKTNGAVNSIVTIKRDEEASLAASSGLLDEEESDGYSSEDRYENILRFMVYFDV